VGDFDLTSTDQYKRRHVFLHFSLKFGGECLGIESKEAIGILSMHFHLKQALSDLLPQQYIREYFGFDILRWQVLQVDVVIDPASDARLASQAH
jgi:hypothetical protein